jgi:multiple sugar transport system permease protein
MEARPLATAGSSPAESRAAKVFLAPALIILGVFFLLPAASAFLLSLTDFDLYAIADWRNLRFVGLANYGRLLADPLFWKSLRITIVFALVGGSLTLAVALAAALAVNSRLAKAQRLLRTIFFAPVVTTLVGAAVVWRYLYQPRYGLVNAVLGVFGVPAIDWLGDTRFALLALIILSIWKNFGYAMILFIAGLRNVPESYYEAAALDGAGAWQQFRHITLPMLRPTFFFVATLTAIGYLQFFTEPSVMTRDGGPLNATLSVALLMFKQGFRWWNMGYAAAIAFVLFLVILAATLLQRRLLAGEGR